MYLSWKYRQFLPIKMHTMVCENMDCRDTYLVLDRPRFGLNWSATCRLEVSVLQWGHFVQIGVSNLVDWFATCT